MGYELEYQDMVDERNFRKSIRHPAYQTIVFL